MNIREAKQADLPAMVELLVQAGLPTEGVAEQQAGFLVAVDSAAEVVGLVGLELHAADGLLRSLVVHPAHRQEGIAAELCRRLLARAQEINLHAVYLLTTDAADYFARHGFARVERAKTPAGIRASDEFRLFCPESATLMRQSLAP